MPDAGGASRGIVGVPVCRRLGARFDGVTGPDASAGSSDSSDRFRPFGGGGNAASGSDAASMPVCPGTPLLGSLSSVSMEAASSSKMAKMRLGDLVGEWGAIRAVWRRPLGESNIRSRKELPSASCMGERSECDGADGGDGRLAVPGRGLIWRAPAELSAKSDAKGRGGRTNAVENGSVVPPWLRTSGRDPALVGASLGP